MCKILRYPSDNQLKEPYDKALDHNDDEEKLDQKSNQDKCSFVKDTGMSNAMFMIRMTSARAIQMQKLL